jgi:hypothetical protein
VRACLPSAAAPAVMPKVGAGANSAFQTYQKPSSQSGKGPSGGGAEGEEGAGAEGERPVCMDLTVAGCSVAAVWPLAGHTVVLWRIGCGAPAAVVITAPKCAQLCAEHAAGSSIE